MWNKPEINNSRKPVLSQAIETKRGGNGTGAQGNQSIQNKRHKSRDVLCRLRGTEEIEERQLIEAERGRNTPDSSLYLPFNLPPGPAISWAQVAVNGDKSLEMQVSGVSLCAEHSTAAEGLGMDLSTNSPMADTIHHMGERKGSVIDGTSKTAQLYSLICILSLFQELSLN